MRRIPWPPPPDKKVDANRSGEASWVYLRRFEGDGTLSGRIWNTCCGCGMEHLIAFNVLRTPKGDWWLLKRCWDAAESYGWRNQHGKPMKRRKKGDRLTK